MAGGDWQPGINTAWHNPAGHFRGASRFGLAITLPCCACGAHLVPGMLTPSSWCLTWQVSCVAGEVLQREGTRLASRQEFAKRVAMDLFRFMESFNKGVSGDTLILPTNCLELWFQKFDAKFRRWGPHATMLRDVYACDILDLYLQENVTLLSDVQEPRVPDAERREAARLKGWFWVYTCGFGCAACCTMDSC